VWNLNIDVWNGVEPEYRSVEWCGYVWNLNIDVWNSVGTCGT
jgi:hypothetical protein